ncbi:hypothetical protein P389DRAFT_194810 [Cystobasidium minutum MCA 4210]|uniref:uncharacterized protein n=1 Tax=Cystobasidium minutum MCA 4210 TaxID=1397322 RepID=UPI0034CF3202|eukprot:jgi/Rhomi1/194810/gm1.3024_g
MGNSPVAGDKRRKTALTLHSLPQEIILSIVEWAATITLEDHLERERLEHEQHHMHHHDHAHDHPDGPEAIFGGGMGAFGLPPLDLNGMNGMGQNGPGVQANAPGGIGDIPFMQNLFGFLGNGPQNPAPPANGPIAGPPAPANNQAENDGTDDEMPPLEPMNSPTLAPTASTSGATPAPDVLSNAEAPALSLTSDQGTATASSVSNSTATSVQVNDDSDSDDAMPPLEPSFQPPHQFAEQLLFPAGSAVEFGSTFGQLSPATSAPLTGALASELSLMQQSTNPYSAQDLEDMPNMDSPVVATSAPLTGQNDDGWTTDEDGDMTSDDGEQQGSEGDTADDEDEDEDESEEEEDGETDEGHATMTDDHQKKGPDSQVSYPDGLPSCPYLPLALVNRSFLNASRTLLYGRHIHLLDVYQAHLLLRTLTSPQVSIYDDEPDADDEEARQQNMLSYLVYDISFDIRSHISLGRGGGSLFIDIIKQCPRLERVAYSADLMKSAQKPLEAALSACRSMKSISLRGGDLPAKDLVWEMRNLARLLSVWPKLETLQILWLKHSINGPLLPAPKIQLTRLSLAHLDIVDSDLVYLLKGSKGTLEQLDLHRPSAKLTRSGIAKVLVEHGPTLLSLQLDVTRAWHPMVATAPLAEAAALTEERASKCRYLIDGLIGHLKVLSELKLSGSLASTILFARLPKSITILAFEDNMAIDPAKVLALLKKKKTATNGKSKKSIPVVAPKLRCFTISRSDGAMLSESMMRGLDKVLEQRKACVHWSYHSPMAVWRPDGSGPPPAAFGALGGLLGIAAAAGGAPFPPDFDFDGFDFPIPVMPPMF